jgi:cysteine desulfurase family protein (TIGR01976 family)
MFDPHSVRPFFPAFSQHVNGHAPVLFDGPGGTQVPQSVMDAMTRYIVSSNSNLGKTVYPSMLATHEVVRQARVSAAAFVNAPSPDQIVFGGNMSTITAHLSRSIAREWQAGDEIIVTALDHSANVSYWRQAAADKGVMCHTVPLLPDDCTLDYTAFEKMISSKTKLVAFGLASNVCGSLSDPARMIRAAKAVGAMTYVDAVHYAPHFLPDMQALDCDFMACSPYKFFGPHMGFVAGKRAPLERLVPYKVEPALDVIPDRWETGTKSFEDLAGLIAAIEYIASIGSADGPLRERLNASYNKVVPYEQSWSRAFLQKAKGMNSVRIHGITDESRLDQRTSTFALSFANHAPQDVSDFLAKKGICAPAGSFYGVGVTDALGLTDKGGVLRIGCVHYNTMDEMDVLFDVLARLN